MLKRRPDRMPDKCEKVCQKMCTKQNVRNMSERGQYICEKIYSRNSFRRSRKSVRRYICQIEC